MDTPLNSTQIASYKSQMAPANTSVNAPSAGNSALLTPEQIQSYKSRMTPTSSVGATSSSVKTSWDAYDQAVGNPATKQAAPAQTTSTNYVAKLGELGTKIGENIDRSLYQRGQNIVSDVQNTPQGTGLSPGAVGESILGDLQTAGHIAGNVAGGVGDIIGSVIEPFLPEAAKAKLAEFTNAVSSKIDSIPGMTPEIKKGLGDVFNTASLLGGAKAEPLAVEKGATALRTGIEGAKDIAAQGAEKVSGMVDSGVKKVSEAGGKIIPTRPVVDPRIALEQSAVKDATPAYSKKLIGEPAVKGEDGTLTPRVQEGKGVFGGRQITSTPLEKEAGVELSKVKGYDPKATNLEKYNLAKSEVVTRSKALAESLKNEKVLRPPKEIAKVVNDAVSAASQESLLLSKTDPVIANYMRVVKNAIAKNDGTLAGELKIRQALDAAYQNARGKMAFGSDKIGPLDELHGSARDALNQDIMDHAQSTDVKAALRSQWNLNRAADVLRDKAEVEGGSKVEQLMKKYPKATKVVKTAGRLVGIGEGVNLLSH